MVYSLHTYMCVHALAVVHPKIQIHNVPFVRFQAQFMEKVSAHNRRLMAGLDFGIYTAYLY